MMGIIGFYIIAIGIGGGLIVMILRQKNQEQRYFLQSDKEKLYTVLRNRKYNVYLFCHLGFISSGMILIFT